MANQFGDLSYTTPRPLYVGQPVEEIKALQEKADQSYQGNKDMSDQLDIMASNLDVRDQDYGAKKAAMDNLRGSLKGVVDSGRWELAGSMVRKAAKDFATDKLLQASLAKRQQEVATSQKLAADDKISATEKRMVATLNSVNNNKPTQLDPITGHDVNPYNAYTTSPTVNVAEEVHKFLKDAKDDAGYIYDKDGNAILQDLGGGQYKGLGKWKGLDRPQAQRMAYEYAMQSPTIRDHVNLHKSYSDVSTFGITDGKVNFDGAGNVVNRAINSSDLTNLGLSDKTIQAAKIYDSNGGINQNRAKALYDRVWESNHINKAINPAVDNTAHWEKEAELHQDYGFDKEDKKAAPLFTFQGQALNPGTRPNNDGRIEEIKNNATSTIAKLEGEKNQLTVNSPGYNAKTNEIALQKLAIDRAEEVRSKAIADARATLNPDELKILESRPPESAIKAYTFDSSGNANLYNSPEQNTWSLNNSVVAGKYERAYRQALEKNSENYTVQPKLGTVHKHDAEAVSAIYNENPGAFTIYTTENGVLKDKDKPTKISLNSASLEDQGDLGMMIGGTEILTDDKGKETFGRKVYAVPNSDIGGLKENIGTNWIKEGIKKNIPDLITGGLNALKDKGTIAQLTAISPSTPEASLALTGSDGKINIRKGISRQANGSYVVDGDKDHPFPSAEALAEYFNLGGK